jgi:hypothetical protein
MRQCQSDDISSNGKFASPPLTQFSISIQGGGQTPSNTRNDLYRTAVIRNAGVGPFSDRNACSRCTISLQSVTTVTSEQSEHGKGRNCTLRRCFLPFVIAPLVRRQPSPTRQQSSPYGLRNELVDTRFESRSTISSITDKYVAR